MFIHPYKLQCIIQILLQVNFFGIISSQARAFTRRSISIIEDELTEK